MSMHCTAMSTGDARTFLASSKEMPVSLLMSCAIMVATPTAELPAPKKMMRASFSGVCWAFMPLMKLHRRCALLAYDFLCCGLRGIQAVKLPMTSA